MPKISDWYYQNDGDWLSTDPSRLKGNPDEIEDEMRFLEWESGDEWWSEHLTKAICLGCGNALIQTRVLPLLPIRFYCGVCDE